MRERERERKREKREKGREGRRKGKRKKEGNDAEIIMKRNWLRNDQN